MMTDPSFPKVGNLRWFALVATTIGISVLFIDVISGFLIALLLAAICAELLRSTNNRIIAALGGRAGAGTVVTLILLAGAVIWPLVGLMYLAGTQAAALAGGLGDLPEQIAVFDPANIELPDWVPFRDGVTSALTNVAAKVGEMAQTAAGFFVNTISSMAVGAAKFFLDLFIFFYALFFFLQMTPSILISILRFSGLPVSVQDRLFERMVSISRATLKGTLIIGLVQGGLGGLGFWATGLEGAAFWSVVMAILAVIPGLGAPVVLFCGAAYLAFQGETTYAIGLAVWAGAVVGTIDNVLRPILVGRDVGLHDLLILISTLGGLAAFGAVGLVFGPVLAGLFVCIWTEIAAATGNTDALPEEITEEAPTPPVPDKAAIPLLDEEMTRELEELRASKLKREQDRRARGNKPDT